MGGACLGGSDIEECAGADVSESKSASGSSSCGRVSSSSSSSASHQCFHSPELPWLQRSGLQTQRVSRGSAESHMKEIERIESRFARYRSWNAQMYPVWRDGDPRYRDCWKGGEVSFEIRSDSPVLTGAKASFNIDVRFPQNQTVLADGQVVWARNCTVNGTSYTMGQSVYPDSSIPQEWTGQFPDRTPFRRISNKKPRFVYVWKAWGKFWQVADGPSSLLSVETSNVPLGSYSMEVVIYHCRGKDKFIPLGYASTQFSVTDQIPFAVTLSQVGDINQGDQNFIQNRAVSFNVDLHDPSSYLSGSDMTFNWDFGDNSGTLISRETSVTHTYLSAGSFKPRVILMAAISTGCQVSPTQAAASVDPVAAVTGGATDVENVVLTISPQPLDVLPNAEAAVAAEDAVATNDLAAEATDTAEAVDAVAEDTAVAENTVETPEAAGATLEAPAAEADGAVAEAVETPEAVEADVPAADAENIAAEAVETPETANALPATEIPVAEADNAAVVEAEAPTAEPENLAVETPEAAETGAVTEVPEAVINLAATVLPEAPAAVVDTVSVQTDLEAVVEAGEAAATPEAMVTAAVEDAAGVQEANEAIAAVTTLPEAAVTEAEAELAAGTGATPAAALVIAKRQAPEMPTDTNCMVYRYGSFATTLTVVQAIESVEIVEVNNVVTLNAELEQNAVDLTVTCQGSLPTQVCTVISDADCISPVQTECNEVLPAPECQMVLRQFFNNSGVFCINVSLTNDVSLAVTSARLSVAIGKRFKTYHPLREESDSSTFGSGISAVPSMLWNFLSRKSSAESRPLLLGRVV
ncbi:hypothetical protein DNTS_029846 [Danionella cerebrum]|uniref:PKD domain-containing protein n=1 Tax=Danionella cerebrum TaxID=2873325 RepID=A0A553NLY6_9TELE|nr:hypothetical protein DNTS_029846 [Danionella translucida]